MEACGWLDVVGVRSRGRSGDDAPDVVVVGRS